MCGIGLLIEECTVVPDELSAVLLPVTGLSVSKGSVGHVRGLRG